MAFIITGGTSGIGQALAFALAKDGHKVYVIGRNADRLQATQQQYPDQINIIQADITKEAERDKITEALEGLGDGHCLINNAGIARPCDATKLTEENILAHFMTNCIAPFLLTQALVPYIENGRVLTVSTGAKQGSLHGFSAYGASKAAMHALNPYMQNELGVNIAYGSVIPGFVETSIQKKAGADTTERIRNTLFDRARANKQTLKPETAAKFMKWLLTEVKAGEFRREEWVIYKPTHWQNWAEPGEVVVPDFIKARMQGVGVTPAAEGTSPRKP